VGAFSTKSFKTKIGWFARLNPLVTQHNIWVHAASLGEAKVALKYCNQCYCDGIYQVIVSFSRKEAQDWWFQQSEITSFLLPWEHYHKLNFLFQVIKPKHLVLIESEFWPMLLFLAQKHHTSINVFNNAVSVAKIQKIQNLFGLAKFNSLSAFGLTKNHQKISKEVSPVGYPKFNELKRQTHVSKFKARVLLSFHYSDLSFTSLPELKPEDIFFIQLRYLSESRQFESYIVKNQNTAFTLWPIVEKGKYCVVAKLGTTGELLHQSSIALIGGSFGGQGIHNFWEPMSMGCQVLVGESGLNGFAREALKYESIKIFKDWDSLPICTNPKITTYLDHLKLQNTIFQKKWTEPLRFQDSGY
jgi:3-deoxy-D-manno-octulosonic-acid transferase